MRKLLTIPLTLVFLALLTSCAKKEQAAPNGPHATIFLRDGATYTGTVTKTSPSEITVTGDDNATRTFAMKDVRSIDYGEAQAETQTQTQAQAQPASPPMAVPAAPPPVDAPPPARYHPSESSIRTRSYELPTGTHISVLTDETIDSSKAVEGQTYAAEVYKSVTDAAGAVVIPRGSNAQVVILSSSKGGRFTGASDLVLDLVSVSVEGRRYSLSTTDLAQRGREGLGKNKRTGEFVGGGAAIGAIIGAIAGQGKGAAIGAASGAAAGAATQVLTRGKIQVPAETVLTFRLDRPLRVIPAK